MWRLLVVDQWIVRAPRKFARNVPAKICVNVERSPFENSKGQNTNQREKTEFINTVALKAEVKVRRNLQQSENLVLSFPLQLVRSGDRRQERANRVCGRLKTTT